MEYFITEIQIRQLLHLSNLKISLAPHGRQNPILKQELSVGSVFTAFKRWPIWDNGAFFGELAGSCE